LGNQHQVPGAHQQVQPLPADEIDLVELWRILVSNKLLIISITLFCTAAAVAAALLLPREYRAEVLMLPPPAQTVEKLNVLNVSGMGEGSIPVSGVAEQYFFHVEGVDLYNRLITNLQSSRLQHRFFDDNKLLPALAGKDDTRSQERIFLEEFRAKMKVGGLKKGNTDQEFISVTLQGKDPAQLAEWLNSFVDLADRAVISAVTNSFAVRVKRTRDSVQHRIASLRATEKSRRMDRIARLEEAIKVARQLGWIERPENPGVFYEQAKKEQMNMSFSLQEMPLYLRGVKALQAEITVLKERTNDDPFIPDLRGLQEYLDFLSSISQDTENVHAMQIDQPAIANDRPVKPKRKMIVVLGFVLGLFLGTFAAFLRNMFARAD